MDLRMSIHYLSSRTYPAQLLPHNQLEQEFQRDQRRVSGTWTTAPCSPHPTPDQLCSHREARTPIPTLAQHPLPR